VFFFREISVLRATEWMRGSCQKFKNMISKESNRKTKELVRNPIDSNRCKQINKDYNKNCKELVNILIECVRN